MPIRKLTALISGTTPLLLNNPQTVDPLNSFSKKKKIITSKRIKTEEDIAVLRDLEIASKIYWSDDLGIYVPTSWVTSAIAGWSFKKSKISKADIRSAVFAVSGRAKLSYDGMKKVETEQDIIGNDDFRHIMILKQGQVRIVKATPIFHSWSFTVDIEFDDTVIDPETLSGIIKHAAKYGGMGDFRPTFGRAEAEISHD